MNYLSRPVFTVAANWRGQIPRSFTLDLREQAIGFNAELFTSRQQYVVNGWRLTLELVSEAEIDEVDDFFEGRFGTLLGFWLPVPQFGLEVTSAVDATRFDIRSQGLTSTWSDSPDQHLLFDNGTTKTAAKITAVSDNGNGTERVTIDSALSIGPSHSVFRLHYVRLASDVEQATFVQEHHQQRDLVLVELPHEYTTAETGIRPIYLYHFWSPSPVDVHWYYTSFEADVISGSKTHSSFPITHGSLRSGMRFEANTVEISAGYSANHPLVLFLPTPNSRPLNVEIKECAFATPDSTTTLFVGTVRKVDDRGTRLVAQCDNFLGALRKRMPPMLITKTCPYQVFEQNTCRASHFKHAAVGTITAINNSAQPPTVECSLLVPSGPKIAADYFAQGWIETGEKLNYELRTAYSSSWNGGTSRLTLKLSAPLLKAIVGQSIYLSPGCDGEATTCKTKFDNFDNFGGFVDMPNENPAVAAIDATAAAGDKK